MAITSYQLQRLLALFRLWKGLPPRVEAGGNGRMKDGVSLSEKSVDLVRSSAFQGAYASLRNGEIGEEAIDPANIIDDRKYPYPVEYELERRAGSFMRPAHISLPPPSPIPKTGKWKPLPKQGSKDLGKK